MTRRRWPTRAKTLPSSASPSCKTDSLDLRPSNGLVRSNNRWPEGYPWFAIVHPDDDQLLGQVGLNVNVRHVSAEGHCWVKASDRRRGVASGALGLVADWGFSNGIPRLFLGIHPENVASNRLAEKMGFTREGVLRSYEPVKDRRPDLVSWSLLPTDPRPWHQQTSRSRPMPQSAQNSATPPTDPELRHRSSSRGNLTTRLSQYRLGEIVHNRFYVQRVVMLDARPMRLDLS